MRSDRARLEDILEACESIRREVAPRGDQLESDVLAHRYFGIDVALLRRAVEDSAPALEAKVRAILEELE